MSARFSAGVELSSHLPSYRYYSILYYYYFLLSNSHIAYFIFQHRKTTSPPRHCVMNINRSSMLPDNISIGSGSCDNDAEFNDAIVSTARGGGIDAASAAVSTTDANPVPADKDHNNLERKEEDTKRAVQFPFKLHSLLQQAEKEDRTDVVCWLPGGKAFKVFKKEEFCSDIMPRFFR